MEVFCKPRIADAGAAGDHQNLRLQREPHSLALTPGEVNLPCCSTQGMVSVGSMTGQESVPLARDPRGSREGDLTRLGRAAAESRLERYCGS